MGNPSPTPLTRRQRELLEEIKAEKEKLKTLLSPPGLQSSEKREPWGDRTKIQKRIDLSVKALRSGLFKIDADISDEQKEELVRMGEKYSPLAIP
jgi:hypothetical protein